MAVYVHVINEGASLLLERWDQAPFPVGSSQVGLDDDHDAVVFPGEAVELVEYEGSAAGLIHSFAERFQEDAEQLEADLLELSKRDSPCWCH
jgi:hypothetical protein